MTRKPPNSIERPSHFSCGCQLGVAHRAARRVQKGQRGEDAERTQRDDERRQFDPRDQQTVERSGKPADDDADDEGRKPGTP